MTAGITPEQVVRIIACLKEFDVDLRLADSGAVVYQLPVGFTKRDGDAFMAAMTRLGMHDPSAEIIDRYAYSPEPTP